ncbi:MAG: RNA methyltransferase [Bifidobacteriaceae bacterium]|jgi:tRNA G18 (ribose-2'-O)-methylase SpoU|nr:RNA methyltransferase [Bifidobacteriaceae bacterium]
MYYRLTDVALRRRIEPERGLFMAESAEVIGRALDAGMEPYSLIMTPKWAAALDRLLERLDPGVPVYVASDEVLHQVTGFHVHRGAVAAMRRPCLPDWPALVAPARRLCLVEDVVDHTNLGAIFRAAAGLGVDAVLVTPRSADPLYRRSVRVSMGTVFQVPWTRITPWPGALLELKSAGWHVAAFSPRPDAVDLDHFAAHLPERLALMLGTEGDGLSAHALELADTLVTIPMAGGVDSLNVAAASAVAFWATRGARRPARGRCSQRPGTGRTTRPGSA